MWKDYREPPFNAGVWPLSAHARMRRSVILYQSSTSLLDDNR
jgi:hypothetical protein